MNFNILSENTLRNKTIQDYWKKRDELFAASENLYINLRTAIETSIARRDFLHVREYVLPFLHGATCHELTDVRRRPLSNSMIRYLVEEELENRNMFRTGIIHKTIYTCVEPK